MSEGYENCLFCKIVKKQIPAEIVLETKDVIAFCDIDPKAPIHYLIIPKAHISTINDITEENRGIIGLLYETASKLAVMSGVDKDGYRVVMNCNKDGGQTH